MISEVNLAVKKPPMIHCPLNWLPASNHKLYILHTRAEKLSSVRLTYESNIVQTKGTLDVGNDWGLLTGGVGILETSCRGFSGYALRVWQETVLLSSLSRKKVRVPHHLYKIDQRVLGTTYVTKLQPVTLEIQHCALKYEATFSNITFAVSQ